MPEDVAVLETVDPVEDFLVAVQRIPGLEWLGEVEEEDIPPDDDFFATDEHGRAQQGRHLRGRIYMVFTNQSALQQILSLWNSWQRNQPLPRGFAKWGQVFSRLRDVRRWGLKDRLLDTGVLDDWRERAAHGQEVVPCELELWYRSNDELRRSARDRVAGLVGELGGQIVHEAVIDEIAYHALLARLPLGSVESLLQAGDGYIALVQCEQLQFVRATGQMAGSVADGPFTDDSGAAMEATVLGDPVVALFDGLPLQNHARLANRLVVDDPDDFESAYPSAERRHGTAMASLVLHGDLDAGGRALSRRLYVRPILRPDARDWRPIREEAAPENTLIVDLIHRAVHRLYEREGGAPAVAPQVCAINLSIGIRDRLFDGALSPLARLLDWLAWKYKVLFVVSAGNHPQPIEIAVPRAELGNLSLEDRQIAVLRGVATDARQRRLLSPGETVNGLTVGALHADASADPPGNLLLRPFVDSDLPSVINAQGMGYRRSIKPDLLAPGGRVWLQESYATTPNAVLIVPPTGPPGQRVATPGPTAGDLSRSCHLRGTSNATALASRACSLLYDVLEELRGEQGGEVIANVPLAVWLKALLVHGARWDRAGVALDQALRTPENSHRFKEYVTRLLGYGGVEFDRVRECAAHRVTALGGGVLAEDCGHIHRFPLPPSLSGRRVPRTLTITLAWISPVYSRRHAWRAADLWFVPPKTPLQVERTDADGKAVGRGTVQHEVLSGVKATAFVDGDNLQVLVSCRADAGPIEQGIPYALATTLEVDEAVGVDIYQEVRVRVLAARVQVAPGS